MKVKLQSNSKLHLVKAVKKMLGLGLKEAKDLVDEQEKVFGCPRCVVIDSEEIEGQIDVVANIDAIANSCDVDYDLLADCEPQVQHEQTTEVTKDDLGVSIHSIDEMSIGWQCRMLFNHEQATRVLSSLRDAKLSVTETHVMYKGNKTTMLTIAKNFPSGVKHDDLDNFECRMHRFIKNLCMTIETEHILEDLRENMAESFEALDEYELTYLILSESVT